MAFEWHEVDINHVNVIKKEEFYIKLRKSDYFQIH